MDDLDVTEPLPRLPGEPDEAVDGVGAWRQWLYTLPSHEMKPRLVRRGSQAFAQAEAARQPVAEAGEPPVTVVVADVRRAVHGAAATPLQEPWHGLWLMGAGDHAEASLTAVARLRHSLDALIGKHMFACRRHGSLPTDAVTVVQAAGYRPVEARRLLDAAAFAHRVAIRFPELRQQWERGQIPTEHIAALAHESRHATDAAVFAMLTPLLPALASMTATEVRRAAAAGLASADPKSHDDAEQDAYDRRRLTLTRTEDGQVRISGVLPALEGHALRALLDATAQAQRAAGDQLTSSQRRADALATIVATAADTSQPSHGGLPAAVTLTIPIDCTDRITDGTAESAHTAPVTGPERVELDHTAVDGTRCPSPNPAPAPAATIDGRLLGDGAARFGLCCADITPIATAEPGSLAARLAGTRVEPLAVGRAQRLATPAQRKALELRDQHCVIDGCQVEARRCQPHHVRPWALGGKTDLHSLALLCWTHHRQADLDRWMIARVEGRWVTRPTPKWRWRVAPRDHVAA